MVVHLNSGKYISSIVLSKLCTQGFGIHFVNFFTTERAHLVGFRYVYAILYDRDGTIMGVKSRVALEVAISG